MEDIYDDLTNYEDVNALEELRTENKELKELLDKRSAAMEKLQKEILQDYDTLEAEFKKLERNYSSLLMTARAEIERKTQRINQLNTEKDMIVLEALKSGQTIRRNFSKGQTKYEVIPGKGNINKNKENFVKQKKEEIKQERRETPVLPPKDAVQESGASNKNKLDNVGTKLELSSTKKSNVNENIAQPKTDLNERPKTSASSIKDKSENAVTKVELSSTKKTNGNENIAQPKTDLHEHPKASASSIKDRRKSMPAVSMPIDTFSSDDELERNYQTKDTRTEHIQSDNERRNTNKISINKNSKVSETSSVDDRVHNYHNPVSRDNYKGRPSRQQDTSSYGSRDKYEVSMKYRKQFSPERGQKRQYREYQDDYHRYERERYKGRSLESPPPESYSRYSRRKSEYRSDYDRYSHDYEKMRHHYDDKYSSLKYRSKDYDEPQAKRQRTELYSNSNAQSKEDKRHRHEREPVDGQPVPCFSPHEYDMLRYSCQSPDFVYTDAGHTKPIKEIMATATVPLEDPRATSKKYVIWKDNGKETLSTVESRNIDIIPVNKAVWNVKPVDIPAALVRRPSQCSDQLVKDIYMDIDSPVPNLDFSIESGEVRETDEEIHEKRSKPKEIKHDNHDFKISKQVTKDLSKKPVDVNVVPPTNIAEYRIPKVGQSTKYNYKDVPIIDLDDNLPHHEYSNRKTPTEDSFSRELLTHKQQYNEREKEHIKNIKSREAVDNLQSQLTTHKQKYNEREELVNVEDSLHGSKSYGQKERVKNVKSRDAEKELSTGQYDEGNEREQGENLRLNNKKYNQLEHTIKTRSRETEDSLRKELSTEDLKERMHVKDSIANYKKCSKLESNKTSASKEREDSFRKELSTHKKQYDDREERVNVKDSVSDHKKYSKLETNKTSTFKEREDSFRKELSTHKQQYDEREERVNVKNSVSDHKKYSKLETNKTSTSKEREDSFRKELSTHKQQYDEREERVNVKDSIPNNKKRSKLETNKTSTSKERESSSRNELSTNKQQYDEREEGVNGKDSLPNNKKHSQLDSNKTSTSKERADSFRKELPTHNQQYDELEERVNVKNSLCNNEKQSKIETNKKPSSTETNANQNQSTLTKIAIVADDLELSDDNSDHTDANRTAPTKSHKNYEKPINTNEAKIDDSGNISDEKTLTSSHDMEIERTVDTAEITGGTEEEKCKESDSNKKQKTKRKKSKSISKDLVDSGADAIHVPEKKSRSKKEKESTPQETKERFSDLFGDSSSLMTPEDLGIPSYLPISEDAQDAVDIKISQIIDGSPLNYKNEIPKDIQAQNRVEIKIQETEAHNDIPKVVLQKSKADTEQKEVVTEIKKKSSKKNKENVIEPSQLPSPIVYENLNPETDLNDPNVVKTVIISTGKQPEIAYESSVENTEFAASVVVNSVQGTKDHLFPAAKEYKTDVLKALATSTPHKEFSAVNALLPNAANTDAISDPCVSKAVASITGSEQVVNQTETNTESSDVPDVRIFVKRRRKAVKRPPMT